MATKSAQAKKVEVAFEPIVEFNNMVAKAAEAAFNLQMESLQAYTKLGIDNVNAGLKVRNADDMASYAELQKSLAQKASDMLVSDAKAFTELNTKFIDGARAMMEDGVKSSVAAATDAAKAVAA